MKTSFIFNVKVRRFEPGDLGKILEIERVSFKEPYGEDPFLYHFRAEPEGFLVAQMDNEVVGYILVSFKRASVVSVAVWPEYRRRGIGGRLLSEGLEILSSRGCRLVRLEVRRSNIPSQKFFERFAFQKIGEIKAYYSNGEDAFVYQRKLE